MGQDLGLHLDSTSIDDSKGKGMGKGKAKEKGEYSMEELGMQRRVWGVTLILNLFLSLQLALLPGRLVKLTVV